MRRGGTGLPHPSAPSTTHSLTQRSQKKALPPLICLPPPPGSSLGGCSQAVVGKSRTTGSIYLTSVSSTIAKHHQRAAAPPRNCASKKNLNLKGKLKAAQMCFHEQHHMQGKKARGFRRIRGGAQNGQAQRLKVCLLLYWHYT